jgi:hypothetical protein
MAAPPFIARNKPAPPPLKVRCLSNCENAFGISVKKAADGYYATRLDKTYRVNSRSRIPRRFLYGMPLVSKQVLHT